MKKTFTFLFLLTLLFSIQSHAQNQIVNLGFENYDNLNQEAEEPVGWNSFMTAQDDGVGSFVFNLAQTQKVERNSDNRPGSSGSYSARIWSNDVFGNVANGNLTTGRIMVGSTTPTSEANHNKTITGNASFNQPFTGTPDSLVVWVKYNAGSGQQARISATLHDAYDYRDPSGTDANAPSHVVAKAVLNFSPTGWTRLSIPFDYNHPATGPQYALISFTTNKTPGGGSSGDEVFIDDMEFIYAPTVSVAPSAAQNLVENQSGNTLTATENISASSREWKFSTGGAYQSFSTAQTGLTYTPQFANAGNYNVRCESVINGQTVFSNVVAINVGAFSNSISPLNTQVVFQNQSGNQLTVSETPAVGSREWKVSNTSGSGYQSFTTAETGITYTPLFFAIDTYYVVCQSTIGGTTVTSNEVEIQVTQSSTPSISITPQAAQNIEVDMDGTTLTANETITPSGREWKFSTSSGGAYQSFSTPITTNTYTPNFSMAGNYYVVCESDMNGSVYTSNEVEINVVDISVSIAPSATQNLVENIAGDTLFATESQVADSREWKYTNLLGGTYMSFSNPQTDVFLETKFSTNDYYYVICESTFNGIVKQSNFVTIIVENGPDPKITPSLSQSLEVDENGTELVLNTGSFTATSQEWLYSDTSGGTFIAFTTPETNTSFTPNFDAAGEYYLVCDAQILGESFRTNEVKITVVEPMVGILDFKDANFKIYSNEDKVIVDLSNKELQDGEIRIYNIEGKLIANRNLVSYEKNIIPLTLNNGIYFIRVSNESNIYQGKFLME